MRTTAAWAFWRRVEYFGGFGVFFLGVVVLIYVQYFYTAATCFDGAQNGDEAGVDCGGACERICAFTVTEPSVQWARSFRVTDGQYNAVAYVENRNAVAGTDALRYTFSLYDQDGLITERTGVTVLPPNSVYPIFEGRIRTNGRVPTRTFLDLEPVTEWWPEASSREVVTVVERTLRDIDAQPRLDAVVRNNDLQSIKEVEVVATIFDRDRNALTASQTVVTDFTARTDAEIVFTWPEPIAKTLRSCEVPTDILVAIDLSGSMNDDGGEPAEPISSVLMAAERFVNRLGQNDQVGLITFATNAEITVPLTRSISEVAQAIRGLTIAPAEETGATNTGDAIVRAAEEYNSVRQNTEARRVLVILTDGRATAPDEEPEAYALAAAGAIRSYGVEVYSIGLGANVNFEFVENLASDSAHAYQALTAADVDTIYQTITSSLCEEGPAIIEIIPKITKRS